MTKWLTFCIVGVALTGCATTTTDPWAELEKPTTTATRPLTLPPIPEPIAADDQTVTYDLDGVHQWDAFIIAAETNTEIADASADALIEQKKATGALIDAGRHQRAIAELRKEIIVEERRARMWERVQYWFLIGVLGAAAL